MSYANSAVYPVSASVGSVHNGETEYVYDPEDIWLSVMWYLRCTSVVYG